MADAWLIPCNAFRFQPPLHSEWLVKAAELICELMHTMSAEHSFSAQVMWALCKVAQEGWGCRRGCCRSGCSTTCKTLLRMVWLGLGTAPTSGFGAGMLCTPKLCVCISAAMLPALHHKC